MWYEHNMRHASQCVHETDQNSDRHVHDDDRHPAWVAALLTWACPHPSVDDYQSFVIDVYENILRDWESRAPEHQLQLWTEFSNMLHVYWSPTKTPPPVLVRLADIFEGRQCPSCALGRHNGTQYSVQ